MKIFHYLFLSPKESPIHFFFINIVKAQNVTTKHDFIPHTNNNNTKHLQLMQMCMQTIVQGRKKVG
jgi:hypothetical protein